MSKKDAFTFPGFETPKQNYSKLPHSLIDSLDAIDSLAELKVVIYILRHTWGFSEYGKPKRITTDEFMHGRKRADGTRIDAGTGLTSNNSVITGLKKAVEHGFILVEKDDSDRGRVKKYYRLNMAELPDVEPDVQILEPDVQNLHSDYAKNAHRTEKETKERNSKKEKEEEEEEPPLSIFKIYQDEIGSLSPTMKRSLREAVQTYSERWVRDAIYEAAVNNVRKWSYAKGILKRWMQQGNQEPDAKHKARDLARNGSSKPSARTPDPEPDWMAGMKERLESVYIQ